MSTPQQDMLAKLENTLYSPSLSDLKIAFPLEQSYPTDSQEFPWISPQFTDFQYRFNNYQIYTQEFITSFATYLAARITTTYQQTHQKVIVLEVGAGDGRLTYFLKQQLTELVAAGHVELRATDTKDWEERKKMVNPSLDIVTKQDYTTALEQAKPNPTLVLCSWMNIDVDWTPDFRKATHVFEYILIGDIFRTAKCGAGWYLPDNSGFERIKLEPTVCGLRGRFDGSPYNEASRSTIYSFIRQ